MRLKTIVALLLLGIAPAVIAQIYKYVDPNGRVIYSDKPPPTGTKAEQIPTPAPPTAAEVAAARQRAETEKRQYEASMAKQAQAKRAETVDIDAKRRALKNAEDTLAAGRELAPGDVQGKAGGGGYTRPEYFDRVKGLEEAVEAAKKDLADAEQKTRQ